MELVSSSCFLSLSTQERWQQIYLALGGTDDCLAGGTILEAQRAILALLGSEECIHTPEDFWRAWAAFLGIECVESYMDAQRQIYAYYYNEAGDDALDDPSCFDGVSPDRQLLALFRAIEADTPADVIYASTLPGIHLDGVTDDSDVLNEALEGGGIHLIMDGDSLVDTLYLWSDTTFTVQAGYTITKKPAPNNGQGMFRNANWVSYPSTPTDTNITFNLAGCTIDGNRRNGGGGNAPGEGPLTGDLAYLNPCINSSQEVSSVFEMCGVDGFYVEGAEGNEFVFHDTSGFAYGLSNVRNSLVRHWRKTIELGDTCPCNDGWHLFGGCVNCVCEYAPSVDTNDDMWAMNANDAHDVPLSETVPITVHSGIVSGPIVNCHARYMHLNAGTDNRTTGRFLSSQPSCYLDDCSIVGITSQSDVVRPMFFDRFEIPDGLGDYRNILIKDCTIGSENGMIQIRRAFVRNLRVENCTNPTAADSIVELFFYGSESICAELEIKNCNSPLTDYAVKVVTGGVLNKLYVSGNTLAVGNASGTVNNTVGTVMPSSEVFLEDAFSGSADLALSGRSPETGSAWSNDASNAFQGPPVSDIRLTGDGFTYNGLGASGTSTFLTPTPLTGVSFTFRGTVKFRTNVAGAAAVFPLFTPVAGSGACYLVYDCSTEQWVLGNTAGGGASDAYAFPGAGTEVEVRIFVLDGATRYVLTQISTDDGETWGNMFSALVTALTDDANPFRPGVWYNGNVGAATGVQLGNLRVGTVDQF